MRRRATYVPQTYSPAELQAAIDVLQNNAYHCFHAGDAKGVVIALHNLGFKIIKTGLQL